MSSSNPFRQSSESGREPDLTQWRERILDTSLAAVLVGGLVALIPGFWLSVSLGRWGTAFIDLIAYTVAILFFLIRRRVSYTFRAALLVMVSFVLSTFIFIVTGDPGADLFWIFVVPPFASLLLGLSWGLVLSGANILFLAGIGVLIALGFDISDRISEFTLGSWLVYSANFIAANALVTIPLGLLLEGFFQSAERQRKLQQDYQILFENNPLPMWVYDLETLGFLAVNEAAIDHYGYSREEFQSLTLKDIRPAEEIPSLEQNIARSLDVSQKSGPWKHRKKDGTLIDVEINSHSLQFQGRAGRLVLANDITERKRSEVLIQKQLTLLRALSEIDRAILSSFNLQMNLKTILDKVMENLEVDAANIMVFDAGINALVSVYGQGFRTTAFEGRQLSLGEGYAGRAILERKIQRVSNLRAQQDNPRLARALKGEGFTSYYGVPLIAKGEILGALEIFHRGELNRDQDWMDLVNTLAGQTAIAIDVLKSFESQQQSNLELRHSYDAAIEGWSRALDLRDKDTEGHSQRVAELAGRLARKLGIADQELVNLSRGALLHDIGKMGVPDSILRKTGPLSEEDWAIMKQHPIFARDMLGTIHYLRDVIDIPYAHHEKWDGTGYPRGLKGEEIPLAARIFALADVYDALTSDRPYRKAWSKEETIEYIRQQAGKHFDPRLAQAFLELKID